MAAKRDKQTTINWKPVQRKPFDNSRVIRFKCSLQNTILDVLRSKGWTEIREEGEWDFYWCDVGWMRENFDHMYMEEHVKICHFRNHYELTRKNLMAKNMKRLKKQIEREFGKLEAAKCDFFPTTFELPVGKSQGKGIFLFRKLKDIMDWKKEDPYRAAMQDDRKDEKEAPEAYVVQRYIEDPYLIGSRKFDLRVYVLVTAYSPMCAWLYREGFARFSNTRFSLDSIDDTYVHLTNVAIQKTAPDYDAEKGCKWSLQQLRRYLVSKHGIEKVETLVRDMDNIYIKSIQAVQKVMINDKHCFELYGYDILVDSKLKPWLIEVNASPSLTASSQSDYELKCRLLEDMLHIIDMENRLTGREKRVGGFDLIWNDGPVYLDDTSGADCIPNPSYPTNTFLGCDNSDRDKQLKQVFKNAQSVKKS